MSTSGASFLIELSSATATKTGAPREARYQLQLNPGIDIPYLAEPKAQLEALTFANIFTNVDDAFYNNAGVKLTWNPYVNQTPSTTSHRGEMAVKRSSKTMSVTLDPGHYDIASLPYQIATKILANRTPTTLAATGTGVNKSNAVQVITEDSALYNDLTVLARDAPSTAPAWNSKIVTARSDDWDTSAYFLEVTAQASELSQYVGGYINLDHTDETLDGVRRIIGVQPYSRDVDSQSSLGLIHLDRSAGSSSITSVGKHGTFEFPILPPSFKFKGVAATSSTAANSRAVELADSDFLGYGSDIAGVCLPNYSPESPWAVALNVDELIGIASTKDPVPSHGSLLGATSGQYLRPIAMLPDQHTGLLQTITCSPLLKVDSSSTLFTAVLGYTAADMAVAKQSPFTHTITPDEPDASAEQRGMDASKHGRLLRTTSVAFHCPSLVSSSYNQHGELAGAVMANVPIVVPSNNVQAWQAMYDTSIPCNLHGGSIDTIDFYLTNQDGDNVDLMGSDFLATVRLSWNQPSVPPLGSFGAEAESAYGLKDVIYAAQQQNGP